MSTADDHNNLASLQDIFGSNTGYGGYNSPLYGNQGSAGSSGTPGQTGSFQTVNMLGQGVNALTSKTALDTMNKVLSNPNATRADLQGVLDTGNSAKNTAKSMAKLGDIATGVGYAGAAGKVLGGELGTGGSAAVTALKTAVPGVGIASEVGSLLGKYDPINPALNKGAELVNKVPGMDYVNEGLTRLGTGISKIPGTGTASLIAGGLSEFPDEILSVPAKIWRSFGDKAKAAAKSSREFALNDMFEEYAKNDPYSTPPGGWVGARTVPGGYGERGYNENISFQAETKDLWEEYRNTDSYKTVLTAQQGIRDLEEIQGQEALKTLDSDRAISELSDPIVNVQPVATHADLGMGTHYSDEYGVWDVETGEAFETDRSDPAPGYPILEPIPFEAPAADPYQPPASPQAVETAPRSQPVEPPPLAKVLPEELVTPRIMTPRRIRPQKKIQSAELASPSQTDSARFFAKLEQGLSRYEQDMARHKMLVKQEADRKAKRNHTIASNGYAAPGMGWNFSTSPNAGPASNVPTNRTHRPLQEQLTGRNSSSY
jgi:hypothetical protein